MKVVLAYSGGLDTSVLVHWISQNYKAEVITFSADVGQGEELDGLEEKAKATGAVAHYTVDLVETFAKDYIWPMIRANAVYENQYLLGTAIARPLIARAQVDIAEKEQADALAHGATGKGNDQCRFELTFAALAPHMKVIAPWRQKLFRDQFPGRKEMIAYCKEKKIPVEASMEKPYSMDRNLLHISYEAGILEDPWFDPTKPENKDMFKLSVAPEDAPEEADYIELEFERGDCVAINDEGCSPAMILKKLNDLGGKHGIGRLDLVENRFVGMKSRGVYETPGGTILLYAHRQIESLTLDREVVHLRDTLIPKYAELVYYGLWNSPEREALQVFFDHTQQNVKGIVRLKLYKGNVIVIGRKSSLSLYDERIASMENTASEYRHEDAEGFIRLHGLRLRLRNHLLSQEKGLETNKQVG